MTWTGKTITTSDPQSIAVISHLSPAPTTSTYLVPYCSMVQVLLGMILIPVWSQLRISSGGISSISTVATTSAIGPLVPEFHNSIFAFGCHDFSLDKIHSMQKWICPVDLQLNVPSLFSIDLSQVRRMPLAEATAILADTTPLPPSLSSSTFAPSYLTPLLKELAFLFSLGIALLCRLPSLLLGSPSSPFHRDHCWFAHIVIQFSRK